MDSAKSLGIGRGRVRVEVLWETAKAETMYENAPRAAKRPNASRPPRKKPRRRRKSKSQRSEGKGKSEEGGWRMAKASPFNAILNPLSSQHASFSVDGSRKSFADSPFLRRELCPGGA